MKDSKNSNQRNCSDKKMTDNKAILMIDELSNVLDVVKLVILLLTVKSLWRKLVKGENN